MKHEGHTPPGAGRPRVVRKEQGVLQRQAPEDYDRQQKARDAAKAGREAKMSRAERAAERAHEQGRAEQTMEAVREFNEARAKERE